MVTLMLRTGVHMGNVGSRQVHLGRQRWYHEKHAPKIVCHMIRIVAENILLFLLPTVIYIAYVYMTREEKPGATRVLDDAPLIWLFVAGAALVIATLVIFGSISGGKPGRSISRPYSRTVASSQVASSQVASNSREGT